MHWIIVFAVLATCINNCYGLKRDGITRSNVKLNSVKDSFISIARSNNPLPQDKELLNELLDKIYASEPKISQISLNDLGFWQICYAPHILLLQRLLFVSFKVYYNFLDSNQLDSYVFYSSKIFGQGWLNTKGSFVIDNDVCRIVWDKIWWDFNTQEEGPSSSNEKEQHVFADTIQSIGAKAFVKEFSQFPIKYWDSDLVSFVFPLTKTNIVASRLRNRPFGANNL